MVARVRLLSTKLFPSFGAVVAAACVASSTATPPPRAVSPGSDAGTDGAALATPLPATPLVALRREDACALPISSLAAAAPGAAPFAPLEAQCETDPFCDWVEKAPDPADLCFVANANIARAEKEVTSTPRPPAYESTEWNGKSPPRGLERVDAHLHFTEDEAAMLSAHGFVALERISYDSYAAAFHDVFQQQLPVFVGIDPILHAVFRASEMLLDETERSRLAPLLPRMLRRMRAALPRAPYDRDTASDLDVYLTVAERLLRGGDVPTAANPSLEPIVSTLVQSARDANTLSEVELFGRRRMIDFTAYSPRGHYQNAGPPSATTSDPIAMSDYFRATTWLSRLELNLVSRSSRSSQPGERVDPSETPREARDALALADLCARAGVLGDLRVFEDVYRVFAGHREDVSAFDLLSLAKKARLSPRGRDAPTKLREAIGDRFRRSARLHYMPQGATDLPVISTLFGARAVPDIAPLTGLVHDAIPGRHTIGAADVAYVLGQDRAKHYLARDLATWPGLPLALDRSRDQLAASVRTRPDVYGAWVEALRRLADPPKGVVPSFMKTSAYADLRMSSTLAGYAQLRHTFVLMAGQGYDAYGCAIPDGWVEPALGSYSALLDWVSRARAIVPGKARYFARVERVLGMLKSIAETELAGAPLTEPQQRWLGMVAEHIPAGGFADSGAPPKYTGWYFDLFPDREIGALGDVGLMADWFTSTNAGEVRYLGVEKAVLAAFVVDTGGEPRVMVGPVTKPFELATPIGFRLDDGAVRSATGKKAPWTTYLVPPKPEPSLEARIYACDRDVRVIVRSPKAIGPVSVELLDHHGDPLTDAVTRTVGVEPVAFAFDLPEAVKNAKFGVEGVHLWVHDLSISGTGRGPFHHVGSASVGGEPLPRPGTSTGSAIRLGGLRDEATRR